RVLFRSKTSLCCGTVGCSTQSRNDLAKHSIIDIHAALPSNSIRVDIERIAVVDMIIDQCCQCVGSSSNGVKVAREVQVDVFHGHNLGESPTRCASFESHHRALGGLADSDNRFLTQAVQRIC